MAFVRKRLVQGLGLAAAATATLLFTAGPAAAVVADLEVNTKASGDYLRLAGHESFWADGDEIDVCDNWGDGAGVVGYWKIGSGGDVTTIYNGGGIGTCQHRNYDFAESSRVYLKVCLRNDGDVKEGTCSAWDSVKANGDS